MSIIDKQYKLIHLDLVEETYNSDLNMFFSISDYETSDFYLKITKNLIDIDLTEYDVFLLVLKEDGTTEKKQIFKDEASGLYYCNLEQIFKNKVGTYMGQIVIEDKNKIERILSRSKFKYEVTDDIYNNQKDGEDLTIDIPITVYDDETGEEKTVNISIVGDNSELTIEEVEN